MRYWKEGLWVGEGIYMCKFTPFQGVSKPHNTLTKELPWFYIEGSETFQEYVVTLGHFHPCKHRTTPTHRGFTPKIELQLGNLNNSCSV